MANIIEHEEGCETTEESDDAAGKRKRKANRKYGDEEDETPRNKRADNTILENKRKERLEQGKKDKEARKLAMEKLLGNWKTNLPCKKCSDLGIENKDLKEKLEKMEKKIADMADEIDDLEYLLQHQHSDTIKEAPGTFTVCKTYNVNINIQ